jgi:hypothetical protein
MRNMCITKRPLVIAALFMALTTSPNACGTTVLYDDLLMNPSFELGGGVGVCPTAWDCSGFGSYAPTNAEYLAGADGLLGTNNAPFGSSVASSIPLATSFMYQTGLGTYTAGNTYTLDLFVGTPLVVPSDPTASADVVGGFTVDFLGNAGITTPLLSLNGTPSSTPGQWIFEQFSFTPSGAFLGQSIGIEVVVNDPANRPDGIADFDIPSSGTPVPHVPEPGTASLISAGALLLPWLRRVFPKRQASDLRL